MTRRLLLSYLAVTVVVLLILEVPLAVFYAQRERERFTSAVERDASVIATFYEHALETDSPLDAGPADQYNVRTGARVVVVDSSGIARVDTEEAVPRDFSTRPEIAKALTGKRATGTRESATLGVDLLYVAIPIASSGTVHGVIRITLDTNDVDAHVHRFWAGLGAIALVILVVMALTALAIARSVTRPVRRLQEAALRFANGDLTVRDSDTRGPPELLELGESMSTMAVQLAAMLDEQRSFVADASHQLRTPLTALRLRLENLQFQLTDSTEVEAAIDECMRLGALVADLLRLARADQAQATVSTDLVAVARDRVETWSAVAEASGVTLRFVSDGGPLAVLAVPGAIEQILDNTLDNAINVAPSGSSVVVTTERGAVAHRLVIADSGPGLSDEDKARAFRRFWRGSNSTPGTGLGLAIAEALARSSGGGITLHDAPEHGLVVTLTLPASNAMATRTS